MNLLKYRNITKDSSHRYRVESNNINSIHLWLTKGDLYEYYSRLFDT